ncbi:MAG: HAD-IC family P-type ATPase [Patescibacteria group bacterium]
MAVPALTDIRTGLTAEYISLQPKNKIAQKRSGFSLLLETTAHQVESLFFLLLIVSGILSFFLKNYTEAIIFVVIAVINTILGCIQEFRAAHAAQALQSLIAHSVTVLRDSVQQDIDYESLVVGDIVLLTPGDVAAADMQAREIRDLFIDQSIRTGESAPIEVALGDMVYSGVSIASGTAIAQVISVGKENSLVSYGKAVEAVKKGNSFELFIGRISKALLIAVLACLVITGVNAYLTGSAYTLSDFLLYAVSMLVGVVPESLPLIITVILMREALFLAKEKVLIKRLRALQELGSLEYLFTDKTGTLTENNIRVVQTHEGKDFCEASTTVCNACYERTPLDKTFDAAIAEFLHIPVEHKIDVTVTPFNTARGFATYAFAGKIIIRGQFHAVYAATGYSVPSELEALYVAAESKGLRVIAMATQDGKGPFVYNGFFAFEDPLKADALELYQESHDIDVPIVIMTGDSKIVGTYIAEKLDPELSAENVVSLDTEKVEELSAERLQQMRVYSRCHPEHKLSIIERYRSFGTVGFIGDGINDALALKAADIGIVVNNASDVARQSADMLLFEKSLQPIITAIRMSRRMYSHIMTYLICTLAGNIGTLFSLTVVSLFSHNLPMLPIQILLNNLLTDAPLLLLTGDTLEEDVERKRPRFTPKSTFIAIVIFAAVSSLFDFAYFLLFKEAPLPLYRTGWFVFSVFAELVLVFSLRSNRSISTAPKMYSPLLYTVLACAAATIAMPYIPFLQKAFSLTPIPFWMAGSMAAILVLYVGANEVVKKVRGGIVR